MNAEQFYDDFYKLALKITGNERDAKDLVQELYIVIIENEKKLRPLVENKEIIYWGIRVMVNMYSKTGKVWRKLYRSREIETKYHRFYVNDTEKNIEQHEEEEKKLLFIEDKLNGCHFYEKALIELHIKDGQTIRQIARATGISATTIFDTIKNVKKYLKNEVENVE